MLIAAVVLIGASWTRGTEYDEDYSVFIASGTPRPAWPSGSFTPGDVHQFYRGHSTLLSIAADLRHTDVHPPLYFWSVAAWRGMVGSGLFRTRLLSVLFSVGALGGVAMLAMQCGAPPVASLLLTLGCYGFTYTGSIARGFALAQLCMIWGTVLLVLAARGRRPAQAVGTALAGGLLLGLASFTNYLAAFGGAGALFWLLLTRTRFWPGWFAAGIGFVCVLPADLYFFLAQRGSRIGQFPPFKLLPSLIRLGKYGAANVFGGLPLYVGHLTGLLLGAVLMAGLAALAVLIGWRWRQLGTPDGRLLLLLCTLATPAGLLALGFVFNNTPIELRYIAFATPFFAVLLASAFASLPRRAAHPALWALFAVQALSIAGLMTRPETMQPQAQAARAAQALAAKGTLALVPYGNDGVGVMAAFVSESRDGLRIQRVDRNEPASAIAQAAEAAHASRVVLVLLGLDADSRSVLPAMQQAFAHDPCWSRAAAGFDVVAFDRVATCHRVGSAT